jgi:uncharacterized protein YneR
MKQKILYLFFILLYFILSSCNSKKIQNTNFSDEIEVIKFMGTITTQSRSIDEKAFWYFKDEHVMLKIRNNRFIDDVKAISNHNVNNFDEYTYAFIVKKGISIDTLYSDKNLKTWILKKNKKEVYYFDQEGSIAEELRNTYSFFYDCW